MNMRRSGLIAAILLIACFAIVDAYLDSSISRQTSNEASLIEEVTQGANQLGYYPEAVMINTYDWGTELSVFVYDDEIVEADREQEVAEELLQMAGQKTLNYPGMIQQIYIAVTCTKNLLHVPGEYESHQCDIGLAIGKGAQ